MTKYGTLKDNEGNKIYPNAYYKVGDIFITTNEENPANRFGGTWQKLPEETFLMTASSNYTVKSTGGENEVTLSINHIPPHNHTVRANIQNASGNDVLVIKNNAYYSSAVEMNTSATGGGQPHNNMPQFYAVYIWIRVA